jgi:hypothetical protein
MVMALEWRFKIIRKLEGDLPKRKWSTSDTQAAFMGTDYHYWGLLDIAFGGSTNMHLRTVIYKDSRLEVDNGSILLAHRQHDSTRSLLEAGHEQLAT